MPDLFKKLTFPLQKSINTRYVLKEGETIHRVFFMRRLSKVLHFSNQRHLILRVVSNQVKALKIGQAVVTKDLTEIGRIFDIFGPVNNPYISIRPDAGVTDLKKYVGDVLYSFDEKKTRKKRKN
jgi:RNA-binding protein